MHVASDIQQSERCPPVNFYVPRVAAEDSEVRRVGDLYVRRVDVIVDWWRKNSHHGIEKLTCKWLELPLLREVREVEYIAGVAVKPQINVTLIEIRMLT